MRLLQHMPYDHVKPPEDKILTLDSDLHAIVLGNQLEMRYQLKKATDRGAPADFAYIGRKEKNQVMEDYKSDLHAIKNNKKPPIEELQEMKDEKKGKYGPPGDEELTIY